MWGMRGSEQYVEKGCSSKSARQSAATTVARVSARAGCAETKIYRSLPSEVGRWAVDRGNDRRARVDHLHQPNLDGRAVRATDRLRSARDRGNGSGADRLISRPCVWGRRCG